MQKTKIIEASWDIEGSIESFCEKSGINIITILPLEYRKGFADRMELAKALVIYKEVPKNV